MQRIANDDDVFRAVHRRGFRDKETVVGEALDHSQRRSHRHSFQRGENHRDGGLP